LTSSARYFAQARTHPAPSRCDDIHERFYKARDAFSAARFKALYRVWKQDGDVTLAEVGSDAIHDAVTAGSGQVETLELGHRYGHLSPRSTLLETERTTLAMMSPARAVESRSPLGDRLIHWRRRDNWFSSSAD
jgi:hypothetical protein